MKEIEVNSCNNCCFNVYATDSWDEGYKWCRLIQVYDSRANDMIDFYKNGKIKSNNKKTLDNCPLKSEKELKITFKE